MPVAKEPGRFSKHKTYHVIFWDVQHLLSTCPEDGAYKPDIVVLDKEKDMAYVIEGTICKIGKIEESRTSILTRDMD